MRNAGRATRLASQQREFWNVPKLWDGQECFILGGGPSLRLAPLEKLREKNVLAVNNTYLDAPWAPVMYFGDCRWYNVHRERLRAFQGIKITTCQEDQPVTDGVHRLGRMPTNTGISTDPTHVYWNSSSGACALNVAVLLGTNKITLFGYDMRRIDGKANYHDDHIWPETDPWVSFRRPFATIATELKKLGVGVLNATPGSALEIWPIVSPGEVL